MLDESEQSCEQCETPNGADRHDQEFNEAQADRISHEIRFLFRPVEMQRSAITNSLLMFKMALGLTQEATLRSCFQQLRVSMTRTSSIELVCAADGPHKLSVSEDAWSAMDEEKQSAVKHFNAMLSSCHRFLGARELKAVDIQLKLEELQLLPLTESRFEEFQKLKQIPSTIDRFAMEVESLLHSISRAGKVLDYHVDTQPIELDTSDNNMSEQ